MSDIDESTRRVAAAKELLLKPQFREARLKNVYHAVSNGVFRRFFRGPIEPLNELVAIGLTDKPRFDAIMKESEEEFKAQCAQAPVKLDQSRAAKRRNVRHFRQRQYIVKELAFYKKHRPITQAEAYALMTLKSDEWHERFREEQKKNPYLSRRQFFKQVDQELYDELEKIYKEHNKDITLVPILEGFLEY